MAAAVRLFWQRDSSGYEIEERRDGFHIVQAGGEMLSYSLEGQYWLDHKDKRRLFEHLANADTSPAGCAEAARQFATEWGFLFRHQNKDGRMSLNDFARWVTYCDQMLTLALRKDYKSLRRNIIQDAENFTDSQGIGYFTLDVAPIRGAELPHVFIRAQSLLSFAVMEMMQAIAGSAMRSCAHCHNFFMATLNDGRRSSETYCSPRCKVARHRAKKKEEKEAAEHEAVAAARPKELHRDEPAPLPLGARRGPRPR